MIEGEVKRVVRTVQSFFPQLLDAKFAVQHRYRAIAKRPFEEEFQVLHQLLPPDAFCIDVGANRGQSIQALRMVLAAARVLSFEPNPVLYARLQAAFAGSDGITVRNEALGSAHGRLKLYVPFYKKFMYDGLASLDEDNARGWISRKTFWAYRADWVSIRTYEVPVIPLDAVSLAPDFIKIDVQGTESAVLRGAVATLKASRPLVMCEEPDATTVSLLGQLGYAEHRCEGGRLMRGRGGQNSIFLHPKA